MGAATASIIANAFRSREIGLTLIDRLAVALLALWLVLWLVLSWGAVQDDALIHLRYAHFLYQLHFITFDGIHRSYGTSSLLYVGLLAALRPLTQSPLLPRFVSTFFHLLLFTVAAGFYLIRMRTASVRARLLAMSLLVLLVAPSAVRWLDDGMETGLVLCLVALVAWQTHRLSLIERTSASDFVASAALGFALVLLRTELASVALLASVTLVAADLARPGYTDKLRSTLGRSHFITGAILAAVLIRVVMHSLLPDTALAKSHGFDGFAGSLRAAATVLTGSLLFGLGLLLLWLISAIVVLRQRHVRTLPSIAANALFPLVLLASALRGQEIQGARYLVWCFLFSIVWNLLELASIDAVHPESAFNPGSRFVFAGFIVLCVSALPLDSRFIYRVLATRAHTMQRFMSEDLTAALQGHLGVASDVGYISYFSGGQICDLAGLVNGRAAAAMTADQRVQRCAAQHPEFAFVNASQAGALSQYLDLKDWRVCGQYDFGNLRVPDRHFLLVAPQLTQATCTATHSAAAPTTLAFAGSRYK
jgi:hypothetical protein